MSDYRTAILVEEDYKGEYSRFALTPHAFYLRYPSAPEATGVGDSHTLHVGVHIWYCSATVGGDDWHDFFTDMSWGLSEGDIEDGNLAYIDWGGIDPEYFEDVLLTMHPRRIAPDIAAEYKAIAVELAVAPTSDLEREAAHAIWHLLDLLQA